MTMLVIISFIKKEVRHNYEVLQKGNTDFPLEILKIFHDFINALFRIV